MLNPINSSDIPGLFDMLKNAAGIGMLLRSWISVSYTHNLPLSKAILILSTSSCRPAILYKPSVSKPNEQNI